MTKADPYYMPTLDKILERVGQSKVLSKIDLAKGYYQVRVAAGSQEKTEISVCPHAIRPA